ncbi:Protein NPG1 [Linum grandiflorum]
MIGSQSAESSGSEDQIKVREFCANGACVKAEDIEAKLDEGNIQAAESSLREGLSLSLEEARSLLGRLEYQRGNVEGALRVFDGIDLQAASERLQSSIAGKNAHKNQSPTGGSQHAASLVLEAIYLKAKSLQKLGRSYDAAKECKSVLDAVEKIFQQGISDVQVDTRLQETVSQAVELLPELWKQAGYYPEAISAYRRALLSQWSLENDCCARIQKAFAVFLLHSGVEASPPSLASQVEGSYVPKHNLEEAVLLLLILVRKCCLGKTKWDPSVMEHLSFALSMCSQTSVLGKELEETMPGVLHRAERWNILALCYSGAGQHKAALNLLRKSLHKHERPDDLKALLLAAKICTEDSYLAEEGVEYAKRALEKAQDSDEHLKSVAVHMLGLCLAKQAKLSSSDFERTRLQSEALKSLEAALGLDPSNLDIIFDLSVQYAEQRNLSVALRYGKQYIDATGGSVLKGWRLLVLILSAQQRFSEAAVVTDAALDETAKWEQGPLLRLKAKLKVAQRLPAEAVETYRYLLALIQAQKKAFGAIISVSQAEDDKVNEYEVWHGLADLYSSLSQWKDAEVCLDKARELKKYSPELLHCQGKIYNLQNRSAMHAARGEFRDALCSYVCGHLMEPNHVPGIILVASLITKSSSEASLPVARSILSDALKLEPANRKAWYHLATVHRDDGRTADAADCFQAASMLEESDPIESFSSVY